MYPFIQYTFTIIAIILTFLLTLIILPTLIYMWQDWKDEQRKRLKDKH